MRVAWWLKLLKETEDHPWMNSIHYPCEWLVYAASNTSSDLWETSHEPTNCLSLSLYKLFGSCLPYKQIHFLVSSEAMLSYVFLQVSRKPGLEMFLFVDWFGNTIIHVADPKCLSEPCDCPLGCVLDASCHRWTGLIAVGSP